MLPLMRSATCARAVVLVARDRAEQTLDLPFVQISPRPPPGKRRLTAQDPHAHRLCALPRSDWRPAPTFL
jgi:hypothetical protein